MSCMATYVTLFKGLALLREYRFGEAAHVKPRG